MAAANITEHLATHSFLQMPRWLAERRDLDPYAKILYTWLLDTAKLSEQNGLRDVTGTYVYCTLETAQDTLGCSRNKAISAFRQLEQQALLIREMQGWNRANRYYLTPPALPSDSTPAIQSPALPTYKQEPYKPIYIGSSIDHSLLSDEYYRPPF